MGHSIMRNLSGKCFIIHVKGCIQNNVNLLMTMILYICLENLLSLKYIVLKQLQLVKVEICETRDVILTTTSQSSNLIYGQYPQYYQPTNSTNSPNPNNSTLLPYPRLPYFNPVLLWCTINFHLIYNKIRLKIHLMILIHHNPLRTLKQY